MTLFELKTVLEVFEIPYNNLNDKDVLQEVSLWEGLKITYFNQFSIVECYVPNYHNGERNVLTNVQEKEIEFSTHRIADIYQLVEFIIKYKKNKLNLIDDINIIMSKINHILLLNSNVRLSISEWMEQSPIIKNVASSQYMANLLPLFDEEVRKPINFFEENSAFFSFNADKERSFLYYLLLDKGKNPDILYLNGLGNHYTVNDNCYSLECSLSKSAQNGLSLFFQIEHLYIKNSDNVLNELLQFHLSCTYFKCMNNSCKPKNEIYYVTYDVINDKILSSDLINYSDEETKNLIIKCIGEIISTLQAQEIRIGKNPKRITKSNK